VGVAAEAECGADVYRMFEELAGRVPLLAAVRPNGEVPIEAFEDAGGACAVMKQLEPLLDTSAMTVTGGTVGQNLARPAPSPGRTANYENISQVLAAMETIGPDGAVTLYDAAK
jgi:dihydroxyacid dehydratase/phosphogluconate dehydratase